MDTLAVLRKSLVKHKLAGYLQPVHDEYMGEYPPPCNRRVEWLTGFSGSAGTAVVLTKNAAIFTDGRYTLQAQNEVKNKAFEQHNSADVLPETWIAQNAKAKDRIGYDPKLFTQGMLARMQTVLAKNAIELVPVENLIDGLWKDRPAAPATQVFVHEQQYAGEDSSAKCKRIAQAVEEAGADMCVLSAPESVNWLLNIRGRDVENTPMALCVATIDSKAKVTLYAASSRIETQVRKHLSGVEVREPKTLAADLKALGKKKSHVLCDPQATALWYTQLLKKAGAQIVEAPDPCVLPKAMKNPTELQGIKNAHIRDGVAVVKLLCWLDAEIEKRQVKEIDICEKLAECRAAHPMFVEPSFTTISGSGPNGAIVHYRVSPESNRTLQKGELMLLDSGGQYPDGTTDITRTLPVGTPTAEHRDRFTRVLKGHIAIATAQFPQGTRGSQLDTLARQYLWQEGLDYDHGTGHGVGCFLGVHEGPQRISKRGGDASLAPGMIVSNEPGYYKTGEYGIRIENLVTVIEKGKRALGFETVTCVPIDTRLVDSAMLTSQEKRWLNDYHAWVLEKLSNSLSVNERAWIKVRCEPIPLF